MHIQIEMRHGTKSRRTVGAKAAGLALATALAATLLLGAPAELLAQEGLAARQGETCEAGEISVGDLGIQGFECGPCTMTERGDRAVWRFDAEPTVTQIRSGGPADGKLKAGDVIVSIDRKLITTAEGGRRWSILEPDETVTVVVRRDGRERSFDITTGARCDERNLGFGDWDFSVDLGDMDVTVDLGDLRTELGELKVNMEGLAEDLADINVNFTFSDLMPDGWLGFSFSCRCTVHAGVEPAVWEFDEPPEVTAVATDGPAASAGLTAGDRITAVDGSPVTDDEGSRLLTRVRVGQTLEFTVERDGRERTVEVTAEKRPIGGE